jgi:hypothetical protein
MEKATQRWPSIEIPEITRLFSSVASLRILLCDFPLALELLSVPSISLAVR